jgi:hypothetical protein
VTASNRHGILEVAGPIQSRRRHRIQDSSEFSIETRYYYVWGPIPTATNLPAGTTASTGNANGAYWPLSFGFHF